MIIFKVVDVCRLVFKAIVTFGCKVQLEMSVYCAIFFYFTTF